MIEKWCQNVYERIALNSTEKNLAFHSFILRLRLLHPTETSFIITHSRSLKSSSEKKYKNRKGKIIDFFRRWKSNLMFFPRDHYAKINDVFLTLCGTQQHNHPPKKRSILNFTPRAASKTKHIIFSCSLKSKQNDRCWVRSREGESLKTQINQIWPFFLLLHSSSCRLHLTARPLTPTLQENSGG